MCSISGIINFKKQYDQSHEIKKMCDVSIHRGPDGDGHIFYDTLSKKPGLKTSNLALGHRRLKIIDLSRSGDQPMSNEDNTVWIVYNGEIYNYLELKEELRQKGHIYKSTSDTEVILHAYEEYGEECVKRFNGMWSFCIYDTRKNILFCSRDRMGEKPFFYYHDEDTFIFSSEIKSIFASKIIKASPNYKAVYSYLIRNLGYTAYTGETFFKDIFQLKAGHSLVIPLDTGSLSIKKYWSFPLNNELRGTDHELIAMFRDIFMDAVKLRLRSDVPVSSYLSGGLDSSSVASFASSILGKGSLTTFSSCFDNPQYDEREYINKVIDHWNLKSHFIFPRAENFLNELPSLIWHQEEPFLHLNVYSQWEIMKAVKAKGFKVILNGHGGDEALAGYPKDFAFYFADFLKKGNILGYLKELKGYDGTTLNYPGSSAAADSFKILLSGVIPGSLKRYVKRNSYLNRMLDPGFISENNASFQIKECPKSFLQKSSFMGFTIYPVPEWVKYEDRTSSAHSVESRSPFLDYRVLELSSSLPNRLKIKSGINKYILREAAKGILIDDVRNRRDKKGFPTPSAEWFTNGMRDYVNGIINSDSFKKRGVFNINEVRKHFEYHCAGRVDYKFEIWSWINLELWMRGFIDGQEF